MVKLHRVTIRGEESIHLNHNEGHDYLYIYNVVEVVADSQVSCRDAAGLKHTLSFLCGECPSILRHN